MSYSNRFFKLDPEDLNRYCPGLMTHVDSIYNQKGNILTKNQICKQEIKSFCASTDPTISIDNCDDLYNDNEHHQPDSMSAYCNCKKQFKNPDDIYNCCLQITNDQYDCQDDVKNNTSCNPVIDGYQPYCDCKQEIAKNDPDLNKYGNAILKCCIDKSNNTGDCTIYVARQEPCQGQDGPGPIKPQPIPDNPPSNPPSDPPSPYNPTPSPSPSPSPSPPSPSPSKPSKPSSRKVGGTQNNIIESLTVPEIIGFIMAIIVIGILIYFIIELSKKK